MAGFLRLVPGLDFKSSGERVATFSAGSIPVPRRHSTGVSHPTPLRPSAPRELHSRSIQREPLHGRPPNGHLPIRLRSPPTTRPGEKCGLEWDFVAQPASRPRCPLFPASFVRAAPAVLLSSRAEPLLERPEGQID